MERRVRTMWERVRALPARDVYVAMLAGYVVLRLASFIPSALSVTDTESYRRAASVPLWDPDFYVGERGWTVPLLYKLVSADTARVVAQLLVSIGSWSVLAATLARLVRPRLGPVAFAAVLLFSLNFDIVAWDSILASESLSLSLTALVWRGGWPLSNGRAGGFSPRSSLPCWSGLERETRTPRSHFWRWLSSRHGSHSQGPARRIALAALVGVTLIGLLATASANGGRRWVAPLADSIEYHVHGDPDARVWFVKHGMPGPDQPLASKAWLDDEARGTYLEYLVTHPVATLTAPLRSLDRLDALLAPDLRRYPEDARETLPRPLADVLYPPSALTLFFSLVIVGLAAALVGRRYGSRTVWAVPLGLVVLTVPHTLLVWHASGQEFGRHSLLGVVLARLGVLILAVLVVDALITRAQPAVERGPRPRPPMPPA